MGETLLEGKNLALARPKVTLRDQGHRAAQLETAVDLPEERFCVALCFVHRDDAAGRPDESPLHAASHHPWMAHAVERDRQMILARTKLGLEVPALRARFWEEVVRAQNLFAGIISRRAGRDSPTSRCACSPWSWSPQRSRGAWNGSAATARATCSTSSGS